MDVQPHGSINGDAAAPVTVERAHLDLADAEVQLNLYLGDNLTQAKAPFTRPEAIGAAFGVVRLRKPESGMLISMNHGPG